LDRTGHSIRRDSHTLDGITYEVIVLAASGGVSARWECKSCGEVVVNATLRPTEKEALALAYDSLNNHHLRAHPAVAPAESSNTERPASRASNSE
jgi:hypothetical protein